MQLRKSLRAGRMAEIKRALLAGAFFMCHKTTGDVGDEEIAPASGLLCAGALTFQDKHGTSSNYQRVCESLDYFSRKRAG